MGLAPEALEALAQLTTYSITRLTGTTVGQLSFCFLLRQTIMAALILDSLREQIVDLVHRHSLPVKQQQHMLRHVDELMQYSFRVPSPPGWLAFQLRRRPDGQVVLLSFEYKPLSLVNNWTLMLHTIQAEGRLRLGWLAAVHYDRNPSVLEIQDFALQAKSRDQGLGSWLLATLLEKCRAEPFQRVVGEIAKQDWDGIERLKHFYSKHGFSVTLMPEERVGKIEKALC